MNPTAVVLPDKIGMEDIQKMVQNMMEQYTAMMRNLR